MFLLDRVRPLASIVARIEHRPGLRSDGGTVSAPRMSPRPTVVNLNQRTLRIACPNITVLGYLSSVGDSSRPLRQPCQPRPPFSRHGWPRLTRRHLGEVRTASLRGVMGKRYRRRWSLNAYWEAIGEQGVCMPASGALVVAPSKSPLADLPALTVISQEYALHVMFQRAEVSLRTVFAPSPWRSRNRALQRATGLLLASMFAVVHGETAVQSPMRTAPDASPPDSAETARAA